MGEVEVLGAPGQVTNHLGDVGQTLVLDKIYTETNRCSCKMQLLVKSDAAVLTKGVYSVQSNRAL